MKILSILLQINETVSTAVEPGSQGEIRLSIIELLGKGGWLMYPIAILSIIAVYIAIERYLTIKRATKEEENFMAQIRDFVLNDNIDAAKDLCSNTDNPIARMVEKGISRIGKSIKNIEVSIENVGKLEIYKLEKGMPTLATISGVAPMIGFLGTVLGMIRAFYNMSMAGNNIEPGLLASGIYEALITTATGLAVGILAYVMYNILVSMIEKVVYKMEATAMEFMDLLHEPVEKIN